MKQTTIALAMVLLVALAGCGGGGKGDGVASLSGGTTTTVKGKARTSVKDQRDALVDYTRCLRKEGIQVDDPVLGDNGPAGAGPITAGKADGKESSGAMIATPAGSISLPSPDDPAFKAADKICQPILEAAQQDMPEPSAEEKAKARDHALEFAKCMRKHGIDMPDPSFDAEGHISIQIPAGAAGEGGDPKAQLDDTMQDAMKACQGDMPTMGGAVSSSAKVS